VLFLALLLVPVPLVTNSFRDNLLGNMVLILPPVIVFLRGVYFPEDRAWSWAFSLGMISFGLGNVVYLGYIQYLDPAPYPSVADIGYLGLYPPLLVGLLLSLRGRTAPLRRSVLLDGLVALLGAVSVLGEFVVRPLLSGSSGTWLQVAVGSALPISDTVLAAMVVGVFVLRGGRPGFYGWIAAGLVTFAVADTVYLFRVADETYVVGTPLDALWAIGLSVVAAGVWRPRRDASGERISSPWTLAAPLLSAVVALGLLVQASLSDTPLVVVLLATATLLAATGRMLDGFVALRDLARVRVEARTDELTGLGNRRMLYEAIEARFDRPRVGEVHHLLLIDLDRFKEVNDSLGHTVGDDVLCTVAQRLASVAGTGDVLVRLGGDEFALLLAPREAGYDAVEAAQRLVAEVATPIQVSGLSLQVGASVGIARAPYDSNNRTDLMRHADVAMYEAKKTGTGVMLYNSDREDNSRERLQLVGELRDAFANDPDQLVVFYQPKCNLVGQVVGAEALLRWQHPKHGLLYPNTFIHIAENNFLMPALTRHVLRRALDQCRLWRAQDPCTTVAVNLSVTSLLDENLVGDIVTMLEQADVAPNALVIEITETILMSDPERSRRTLIALRDHGVGLAVDDYGTGHCSLAYLRNLPVHELKLDRSFVRDIAIEPRDAAIVKSTIELAHSLGLVLVAEGVESAEAARLLHEMGCDLVQGYYFGRPGPPTEQISALSDVVVAVS
jgi:diguanylate cyclase (GGDEF)-like protein